MRKRDLVGKKFGRLVVESVAEKIRGRTAWVCRCACGARRTATTQHLVRGAIVCCGAGQCRTTTTKHGHARKGQTTPEYGIWSSMKARCRSKENRYYAGRGITLCKRWESSFAAFLSDMGPKPFPGATVERIDNSKGYSPANCRWATHTEQMHNQSKTLFVIYEGERLCLAEAARRAGVAYTTAHSRMSRGMEIAPGLNRADKPTPKRVA